MTPPHSKYPSRGALIPVKVSADHARGDSTFHSVCEGKANRQSKIFMTEITSLFLYTFAEIANSILIFPPPQEMKPLFWLLEIDLGEMRRGGSQEKVRKKEPRDKKNPFFSRQKKKRAFLSHLTSSLSATFPFPATSHQLFVPGSRH